MHLPPHACSCVSLLSDSLLGSLLQNWPNDALMQEWEWLVSLIVGQHVELLRESYTFLCATADAVQQLHLDWRKGPPVPWDAVWVGLYYPDGGAHIEPNGNIRTAYPGQMLLFNGFEYVHAGGPQGLAKATRHHAVFVPTSATAQLEYYKVADKVRTSCIVFSMAAKHD